MEYLYDDCWWRGTVLRRHDDPDPETGGAQFEVEFLTDETSDCATASLRPLLEVRMRPDGDSRRLEVQQPAAAQLTHTRKRQWDGLGSSVAQTSEARKQPMYAEEKVAGGDRGPGEHGANDAKAAKPALIVHDQAEMSMTLQARATRSHRLRPKVHGF